MSSYCHFIDALPYILLNQQQPTSFTLHTHDIDQVSKLPDFISLFSAVAEISYSSSGQAEESEKTKHNPATDPQFLRGHASAPAKVDSIRLFLQVSAAADYFTTDVSLMRNVPPVYVDISKKRSPHSGS